MRGYRLPVRLLGVPLRLDPSFLLILPLLAWLIASQIPAYVALMSEAGVALDQEALTQGVTPALLGLVAATGLFVGVLLHELGHVLVARFYGVQAEEITLWFLGGVASFRDMPRGKGAEAIVAVAGPITSMGLALLAGASLEWVQSAGGRFVLSYLAIANGALGVFNLLPALPLDGGRILRSLLALAMDRYAATRVAVGVSRVVAIGLGVWGFVSLNLLMVAIAFLVYQAGGAEGRMALLERAFAGKTVRDLMTPDPATIDPDVPLDRFARLRAFRSHAGYPVVDQDGRLRGFARVLDADVEEGVPDDATVADVTVEAETITPHEPLAQAATRLATGATGRLIVVDERGRVVGILSRSDIVRELERLGGPDAPGALRGPDGPPP